VLAHWARMMDSGRLARADLQQPNLHNVRLCDALWEFLNSEATAFDSRLRWSVLTLYKSIWGHERPACLPSLPEPTPVFVEEPPKRKGKVSGATIRISADLLSQANQQKPERRAPASSSLRSTQSARAPVKVESSRIHKMEVDSPPPTASSVDGQEPRAVVSPKKEGPTKETKPKPKPKPKPKSKPKLTPTPTPAPPPTPAPAPAPLPTTVPTRTEESSEESSQSITIRMDENGGHSLAIRDLPKPVKRKGRDFDASFSDDGILHIDINNPEKRQKLEEQARAELAAPPRTTKPRRASTGTPRLPAIPASLRNKTFSAVLSPPNVVTITISSSK